MEGPAQCQRCRPFHRGHARGCPACCFVNSGKNDFTPRGMIDDVARHFGNGGRNDGRVTPAKAQLNRQSPSFLTGLDDVGVRFDRHAKFLVERAHFRRRLALLVWASRGALGAERGGIGPRHTLPPRFVLALRKASPSSKSSAVPTPSSVKPSWTIANAT